MGRMWDMREVTVLSFFCLSNWVHGGAVYVVRLCYAGVGGTVCDGVRKLLFGDSVMAQ